MNDHSASKSFLPTESDFDPAGGCLDAQCAWGHFGGLSLDAAFQKFCEHPDLYQEDFMFMGGAAFVYYFPVIDRHVRESHADVLREIDVEAMWILAMCIKNHIEDLQTSPLRSRIHDLIHHVRSHLSQYCIDVEQQREVDSAWAELQGSLSAS